MGIQKKSDGRYVVGKGIESANEYKGSLAFREITIQLTENGATERSVEYLNFLKDYALYHASLNEPIKPPNLDIWISGNGFSKAVEADDINITESGFEIGGITYDGSAWDYSNAGQGSGGSSLPNVTSEDNGKILGVENGEWSKVNPELPTVSSEDNGKILGVENGEWGVVENQGGSGGDFFFIHLDWVGEDENGHFQTRESANDIYVNRNKRLLMANTEDFGAGGICGVFWAASGDDSGYLSVNQIYASLGSLTSYLMMDIQNSNQVQNESSDPFVFTGENDSYWQIEMTPQE